MNANTRTKLIAFIEAVEQLAIAVSSVAGTRAVTVLIDDCEQLKSQLEKDETII